MRAWLTGISSTCCDLLVVRVLQLGSGECVAMLLLPFTLCECLYTCSTVVPWGVMIGMSGESWCQESTLSPIPETVIHTGLPHICRDEVQGAEGLPCGTGSCYLHHWLFLSPGS